MEVDVHAAKCLPPSNRVCARLSLGVRMVEESQNPTPGWRERVQALRNIPPVLRMVWEAAPKVILSSLLLRITVALLPLAVLAVTGIIVNNVHDFTTHARNLPPTFWWLVALEFFLATFAAILSRLITFCDVVLADKYSRHVSTKIMDHASRLALTPFEDPYFMGPLEA